MIFGRTTAALRGHERAVAPEMEKGWGPEGSLLAAVIVIAVNLAPGICIQVLRRNVNSLAAGVLARWRERR